MENSRRKRTQFRKEFTRAADALEEAFQKHKDGQESISVEGKFSRFSDCAEELFACESTLRDLWCESEVFNEAAYEQDQDRAVIYKTRWSELKAMYQNFVSKKDSDASSLLSAKSILKNPRERKVKMPTLEISKFNGEVKKWLLFWGQFSKIDEDSDINDSDKFQYLLQSMEPHSSARQLVESYPPCGMNYKKALEALKSRFARDDVLIETYVRGLLALMQEKGQKPTNAKELPALYDSLQTHLQALETLGVTKDKYASILFPMVESALPDEVLRAWNRYRAADRNNNDLSKLVDFLRQEVESEERIQLAHRGAIYNSTPDPKVPTCCFVAETKPENRNSSSLCIWCDKDTHCTAECHKAAKMTLEQRTDHIKAKRACTICLRPNHIAKRCKNFPKCLFCKKRHSILMCPDMNEQSTSKNKPEPEKFNNLHCELKSTTLLQTIVVQVASNDGKSLVRARALIDSGAQRSYVRTDLVEMLSLRPARKEFVTHCLFGGKEENTEERQIFDISVRSLTSDFEIKMSTIEQENICNFLPKIRSSEIIRQLEKRKIILTDTSESPDDVQLLIGADCCSLLLTGEFVHVSSTLTAIKTKLGWTIQGPVTGIYSSLVNTTTTLHCLSRIHISDLWNSETLGIKDTAEQLSENLHVAEVLENFEETITVKEEGRYEVSLPWFNVPSPQTNRYVAKKSSSSTTRLLQQLGVLWLIKEDCLGSNANTLKTTDGKLTKKTLLSVMQRVFDSIGMVSATTIVPKMILLKSWPMKLTWDEELPAELADEFRLWLDQAHLINEVTIPRRLATFAWSVFVTSRVNEIKSYTFATEWRHISGNLNPADLPARGISPKRLLESRWCEGPDWLRLDEQDWPVAGFETDFSEVKKERRKTVSAMLTECNFFLEIMCYFSVYSKIVRMIGWIFRLRRKPEPFVKELSYDEFVNAENSLKTFLEPLTDLLTMTSTTNDESRF